ncbi:hypothetical protein HRbin23_01047 [bacterium HR23]|nr:hypothetical protein HRbin23_01047 [bacterium HR23]
MAEVVIGVMPPVSRVVDARRLMELRASIIPLERGARLPRPARARASSYTYTNIPVRAVAEGTKTVIRGKEATICQNMRMGLPPERAMAHRAKRLANPLLCTASPIPSTPSRKNPLGLVKPEKASPGWGTPRTSTSRSTPRSPTAGGGRASSVQKPTVSTTTASTRCPSGEREGGRGERSTSRARATGVSTAAQRPFPITRPLPWARTGMPRRREGIGFPPRRVATYRIPRTGRRRCRPFRRAGESLRGSIYTKPRN